MHRKSLSSQSSHSGIKSILKKSGSYEENKTQESKISFRTEAALDNKEYEKNPYPPRSQTQRSHTTRVLGSEPPFNYSSLPSYNAYRILAEKELAEIAALEQGELEESKSIEVASAASSIPAENLSILPTKNPTLEKLSAKGLTLIHKIISVSNKFCDVELVFENEQAAKAFRTLFWEKCEREDIHSVNVHYADYSKNKGNECVFKVVTMINSEAYFETSKDYSKEGEILLSEFEKLVDITNIPQIFTDLFRNPIADEELPESLIVGFVKQPNRKL